MELEDKDLSLNYRTHCDPRLNYEQSLGELIAARRIIPDPCRCRFPCCRPPQGQEAWRGPKEYLRCPRDVVKNLLVLIFMFMSCTFFVCPSVMHSPTWLRYSSQLRQAISKIYSNYVWRNWADTIKLRSFGNCNPCVVADLCKYLTLRPESSPLPYLCKSWAEDGERRSRRGDAAMVVTGLNTPQLLH